jgi:hypothetical protein
LLPLAARRPSVATAHPPPQPHRSPVTLHSVCLRTLPSRASSFAPPPNPTGLPAGPPSRTTQPGLARLLQPPSPFSTTGCACGPTFARALDRPPVPQRRRPRLWLGLAAPGHTRTPTTQCSAEDITSSVFVRSEGSGDGGFREARGEGEQLRHGLKPTRPVRPL